MGNRLVIESLEIRTEAATKVYSFSRGVTAVTGPIGSGKSSLFELIKYGLGGRAQVMPAVRDNVKTVTLQIQIGTDRLTLTRTLGSHTIEVFDIQEGVRLPDWSTTNRKNMPKASQELLARVGLPHDLRVPRRRTKPTGETVPISFFDVYRYLYLGQNGIDTSVVGHNDQNLNIKRMAVFELLYGLADPKVMELAALRGKYAQEAARIEISAKNVFEFLRSNGEPEQLRLSKLKKLLSYEIADLEQQLRDVRARTDNLDSDGLAVRQVTSLRNRLSSIEDERRSISLDIEKERGMLAQLALDEQRIGRERAASRSLTGLEFTVCPRCMQSIANRHVEDDVCNLCCQPQDAVEHSSSIELSQIRDQRKETEQLLNEDVQNLANINAESDLIRDQLSQYLTILAERSERAGNPLLDEVADLSSALTRAQERLNQISISQARWAAHEQLRREAEEHRQYAEEVERQEKQLRQTLEDNSTRIEDLSRVFNEILSSLRDPWYNQASIDPKTYLPIVDGEKFDMLSVGGARKTLVNLAYHLANLSMSISESSAVLMPTMLIVDSPRKNVGESALDSQVVEAVYRRLRTLQDASGEDFQIIIADNDLPKTAQKWIRSHVRLDYQNPLVPGVSHPGKAVETVSSEPTFELV
jgi:hypothetical protein